MAEDLLGAFKRPASTVFFLVESRSDPSSLSKDLLSELDDVTGIQAHLKLESEDLPVDRNWYHHVVSEAKVGSRWGRDLKDFYRDFIEDLAEGVGESDDPVQYVATNYEQYDADAFESGIIGDDLSLGLGIEDELESLRIEWGSQDHAFSQADLHAAVGYAANKRDLDQSSGVGSVVFEIEHPISEIGSQLAISLSDAFRELQFAGLSVAVIMPDERGAEKEIRERFRSLGRFSVESVGDQPVVDDVEEITDWLDSWYDKLCYEVEGSQIRGEVAAKAGATASQLDGSEKGVLFTDAITHGLLYEYSEGKLRQRHKDDFDDLWEERIIGRKEYDQYNSERQSFPRVTVARTDGRKHIFELRLGPNGRVTLNNVPVSEQAMPHEIIIEKIDQFLQADPMSDNEWHNLIERLETVFPIASKDDIETMVAAGLLSEQRLPPEDHPLPTPPKPRSVGDRDTEWFRDHWRAILSTPQLSTVRGSGIIKQKLNLRDQLSVQNEADATLYQKLEQDIARAKEYFATEIMERVTDIIPNELDVTVDSDMGDTTELVFSITPDKAESASCTVQIEEPYREVRVNEGRVAQPIISNVVQEVVKHLDHVWYFDSTETSFEDVSQSHTLYNLFCLYATVAEAGGGDRIYFEEFAHFCSQLAPVVEWIHTTDPSRPTKELVLDALSEESFINRLRNQDVTFHRKGDDPWTPVRVKSGNKYIAVELEQPLDWDHGEL